MPARKTKLVGSLPQLYKSLESAQLSYNFDEDQTDPRHRQINFVFQNLTSSCAYHTSRKLKSESVLTSTNTTFTHLFICSVDLTLVRDPMT